ncbi:MAG: lytic murein transglycosylase [Aurantimonas endophytica]|jgi:lytic murein transglycosylase|uniref:Lytic murein transglycosylase n=2 Tax=Aurantimonas endophytica TaxID=1522175 RepID=A0A7W6HH72_9HYPH|nr:lytic murein transglycosylase [Aurantimonas endophytica]MBB4005200.1 lytic murein transglycosylase [Aurantimonas endophytica]MCO6406137.1 lytic murein transglycosylase [Aurantimonas endophytica]
MMARLKNARRLAAMAALALGVTAGPALAAQCGNSAAGFNEWKQQFAAEAQQAGISQRTIQSALMPTQYSSKVVSLDRNQHSMNISLEAFMERRAPASFVAKGKRIIQQNARLLDAVEQRYGVQKEVLVAIWGMETGFGANSGNMNIFSSLATLSYDCRRSAFFTEELLAALMIVERGDMQPSQMRGAWAGEIGQTQFLAKNYLRFAVDGDGNGRRDLINSTPDVLYSTANFLRQHGWQPGAGYQEGQPNFARLRDWNRAGVYQKALALFATKLAN